MISKRDSSIKYFLSTIIKWTTIYSIIIMFIMLHQLSALYSLFGNECLTHPFKATFSHTSCNQDYFNKLNKLDLRSVNSDDGAVRLVCIAGHLNETCFSSLSSTSTSANLELFAKEISHSFNGRLPFYFMAITYFSLYGGFFPVDLGPYLTDRFFSNLGSGHSVIFNVTDSPLNPSKKLFSVIYNNTNIDLQIPISFSENDTFGMNLGIFDFKSLKNLDLTGARIFFNETSSSLVLRSYLPLTATVINTNNPRGDLMNILKSGNFKILLDPDPVVSINQYVPSRMKIQIGNMEFVMNYNQSHEFKYAGDGEYLLKLLLENGRAADILNQISVLQSHNKNVVLYADIFKATWRYCNRRNFLLRDDIVVKIGSNSSLRVELKIGNAPMLVYETSWPAADFYDSQHFKTVYDFIDGRRYDDLSDFLDQKNYLTNETHSIAHGLNMCPVMLGEFKSNWTFISEFHVDPITEAFMLTLQMPGHGPIFRFNPANHTSPDTPDTHCIDILLKHMDYQQFIFHRFNHLYSEWNDFVNSNWTDYCSNPKSNGNGTCNCNFKHISGSYINDMIEYALDIEKKSNDLYYPDKNNLNMTSVTGDGECCYITIHIMLLTLIPIICFFL